MSKRIFLLHVCNVYGDFYSAVGTLGVKIRHMGHWEAPHLLLDSGLFMVVWWVNKKSPIIPRNKTGQINLTAINLKKKAGAPYFKKK